MNRHSFMILLRCRSSVHVQETNSQLYKRRFEGTEDLVGCCYSALDSNPVPLQGLVCH